MQTRLGPVIKRISPACSSEKRIVNFPLELPGNSAFNIKKIKITTMGYSIYVECLVVSLALETECEKSSQIQAKIRSTFGGKIREDHSLIRSATV